MTYMKREKRYEVKCPMCKERAQLRNAKKVVPYHEHKDNVGKKVQYVWWCPKCGEYVFASTYDKHPLGRISDKNTRRFRYKLHASFDKLWKSGKLSRNMAYILLSGRMGIKYEECHIAKFNISQCKKAQNIVNELLKKYDIN